MRGFIFILMIALLPLRGWMGEAMATTMAANEVATNNIATKSINTPTKVELSSKMSSSDCHMLDAKQPLDSNDESSSNQVCSHCQACHATGLVSTVEIISCAAIHFAQPLAFSSQFSSPNSVCTLTFKVR
jgi:hypothetical protein